MGAGSPQERISHFWSTVAPDYEAHGGNVPADDDELEQWVNAVRGLLPGTPADVLDVGTGTGFLARLIAGLGHRVTGIDLAPGMLAIARADPRNAGLELDFREGDAVAPPFPHGSFDVVSSRHLLWTLREPRVAFANWRRLLRPGGRVVAVDLLFASLANEDADEDDAEPGPFEEHYTAETRAALPIMAMPAVEQVVELFRQARFDRVESSNLTGLLVSGTVPYAIVAFK